MAATVAKEDEMQLMNVSFSRTQAEVSDWDLIRKHVVDSGNKHDENFDNGTWFEPLTWTAKLQYLIFLFLYRVYSI